MAKKNTKSRYWVDDNSILPEIVITPQGNYPVLDEAGNPARTVGAIQDINPNAHIYERVNTQPFMDDYIKGETNTAANQRADALDAQVVPHMGDFVSAATKPLDVLMPSKWVGLLDKDYNGLSVGDRLTRLFDENNRGLFINDNPYGLFSKQYAEEHPYWAMAGNTAFDIASTPFIWNGANRAYNAGKTVYNTGRNAVRNYNFAKALDADIANTNLAVQEPHATFVESTKNGVPRVYTKPEAILGSYNTRTNTLQFNPNSQYKFSFEEPTTINWEDAVSLPTKITEENAAAMTREQWTAAQDAAVANNDWTEALRLRTLHTKVKGYRPGYFHETDQPFNVFRTQGKNSAADALTPYGIFTKTTDKGISLGGYQMGLNVKYENPLHVADKGELLSLLPQDIQERVLNLYKFGETIQTQEELQTYLNEANYIKNYIGDFLDKNGYDALIIDKDWAGTGLVEDSRWTDATIVPSSNYVKSADAVTYDDTGKRIALGDRDDINIDDTRWGLIPWLLGTGTAAATYGASKQGDNVKAYGGLLDNINLFGDGGRVHSVQKGDTLWGISQQYNIPLAKLRQLNPKIKGDIIIPGQQLQVSPQYSTQSVDVREERKQEEILNRNNLTAIQGAAHDGNYVVVDKQNSTLTVYDRNNSPIFTTKNISSGESGNDFNTITYVDKSGSIRNKAGNNSTPAGISTITGVGTYHGFPSFTRGRFNSDGSVEDIASSFHWGNTSNKKASNGCVRVGGKELEKLQGLIGQGTMVYTLPEKGGSRFVLRNGKLNYVADNPYGETEGDKKYWDDYNVRIDKSYSPLAIWYEGNNTNNKYNDNVLKYVNSITTNKESLQKSFGLTSDEYNRLAELAVGIAQQETKFGTSRRYKIKEMMPDWMVNSAKNAWSSLKKHPAMSPSLMGNIIPINQAMIAGVFGPEHARSRGMTQIKMGGDNAELRDIYDKLGINEDTIQTPEMSAVATMARLAYMYNTEVRGRDFTGANNKKINPWDALLYKYNGHGERLTNHTAIPENNEYIRNIKRYSKDFGFVEPRQVEVFNNQQSYGGLLDMANKFKDGGSKNDYNTWKKKIKDYKGIIVDGDDTYDYYNFFKDNPQTAWDMLNGNPEAHFTDRYKTPNHPTYSNESIYSRAPYIQGGTWNDYSPTVMGQKWNYALSPSQVNSNWDVERTINYLADAENEGAYVTDSNGRYPIVDGTVLGGTLTPVTITPNNHSKGGSLKSASWNDLSMREKADIIKVGVKHGLNRLADIKSKYNEFALGGDLEEGNFYGKGGKKNRGNQAITISPNVYKAMKFFMDRGMSKVGAAGLVGGFMRESSGNLSSNALNPSSKAIGIAQWLGPRKRELVRRYGSNPTFEQQLEFVWHELNTNYKRALRELMAAKTPTQAADAALGWYEFSVGPMGAVKAFNDTGQDGWGALHKGRRFTHAILGAPYQMPQNNAAQEVQQPMYPQQQYNQPVMMPQNPYPMPMPTVDYQKLAMQQMEMLQRDQEERARQAEYLAEKEQREAERNRQMGMLNLVMSMGAPEESNDNFFNNMLGLAMSNNAKKEETDYSSFNPFSLTV